MMPRYAARRDTAEPDIVDALEKAGCTVYRKLPTDLLVWHPRFGPGTFKVIEAKTLQGKRDPKIKIDKRQREQIEFCETTGTPRIATPEGALHWLGLGGEHER